jgi:superfamily I DNA/RNA helicase
MTTSTFQWSQQQESIFDWFAEGEGNLVVRARAGTGKTTTILEGVSRAPESRILLAAFNKRIADELGEKLSNPRAEAKTLHSVGFAAVRRFWSKAFIDSRGGRASRLAEMACGQQAPDAIVGLVARIHTRIRECFPFMESAAEARNLMWQYDLIPDQEWDDFGWDEFTVAKAALKARDLAKLRKHAARGIDFADMIFLPVANNWLAPTYDLVVVDEAQDMNDAQLEIARRIAKGRVVVVGDDRQAIYGFRGADSGSLDRLKRELDAEELGLTVTYRCGKAIVREAQQYVADYEAASGNADGEVRKLPPARLIESLKPGDAVLSRTNAPLIASCLQAISAGLPARIEGKDVAAMLRNLLRKLATGKAAKSIPELIRRVASWEEREVVRAEASNGNNVEDKVSLIRDKAAALRYLADGASGVSSLRGRIDDLFNNLEKGCCIVFSTVHRAKGLEWPRVFILGETFRDSDEPEERNIRYVAVTRAKKSMFWVN